MTSPTTKKDIRYSGKDFNDFKNNLINFVKIYYKNTFNDFNSEDPGMMFLEMSSYVGDVLSFYQDKQFQENLLKYTQETSNIIELAQIFGYKPLPATPASVNIEIYQLIPAIGTGESNKPDYRYALKIKAGMEIGSVQDNTIIFKTLTDVDFNINSVYDPLEISVYELSGDEPIWYLLKKTVKARNGVSKTINFTFSEPERYKTITLTDTNVINIEKIVDSDGNLWYEVPYLAQDTILDSIPNSTTNSLNLSQYNEDTPYLLKWKTVPRRFITRYNRDYQLEIQFGSGITGDQIEEITPNPDNVGLTNPMGVSKISKNWNLSNFLYTDSYGLVPTNTNLTVYYNVGGGVATNVIPNILKLKNKVEYYDEDLTLDQTLVRTVKNSLDVNNVEAGRGGKEIEEVEDIRQNALAYFTTQDRAVSNEDYVIRTLNMPAQNGTVSKAYVTKSIFSDNNENLDNTLSLDLYILSFNANKQLSLANLALKENLKVYLDQYRILTDAINIIDAYIINIGIVFEIVVQNNFNDNDVLLDCLNALKLFFNIDNWQINQPIIKADINRVLTDISGVQSVINIDIVNYFDTEQGYNSNVYDINSAIKNEVLYPSKDVSIFEVKYPNKDIIGKVINI